MCKKNISATTPKLVVCHVHNRHVLRAVSPGNAMIVGEGRRSFFFGHSYVFVFTDSWKGCAERRRKKGGREEGRASDAKRGETETRRKLVETCGKLIRGMQIWDSWIGKEGRGLLSLPKKAATFISTLCSCLTVDWWHRPYVNRRSAIKDSSRPFLRRVYLTIYESRRSSRCFR